VVCFKKRLQKDPKVKWLKRRDFRKTKGQMVEINETFDMQPCYGLDISFNDSVLSTFLFIIIIPNTEFITYGISECNAQNLACQSTTRTCGNVLR